MKRGYCAEDSDRRALGGARQIQFTQKPAKHLNSEFHPNFDLKPSFIPS